MIQLSLIELKRLWKIFFVLYAVSFIFLHYWGTELGFMLMPLACSVITTSILKRSAWYLTLPWSKKTIIGMVIAQNAVVFLLCSLLSLGMIFVHGKLVVANDLNQYIEILLVGWFLAFVLGSVGLLHGIAIRKNANANVMLPPKWYVRFIYMALFFGVVWALDLFDEPIFYVLLVSFGTVGVYLGILKEFVMPNKTRRKGNIVISFLGAATFTSVVGFIIYCANFGDLKRSFNHDSLDLLGRFPSFISQARAIQMFKESQVGSNPSMTKFLNSLKAEVSMSEWRERTKKCTGRDCISLSSRALDIEKISPQDLSENFMLMVDKCSLFLGNDGHVECSKVGLGQPELKLWLQALYNKKVLSEWLGSDKPNKQIFAIKGTPYGTQDGDLNIIKTLMLSSDSLVRTTASSFVANQEIWKNKKLDCEGKDAQKDVCKQKQKEFNM